MQPTDTPTDTPTLDMTRLLSISDIARFFAVSRRTIYRWIAEGRLAKPINVTRRIKRWPPSALVPLLSA